MMLQPRLARFLFVIALSLIALAPHTTVSLSVTLVRGPYLQQPTERSMVVVWATREAGPAEVRYGASAGTARTAVPATSRLVAATQTGLGFAYYQHVAPVTGLAAATTYAYQPFVSGAAVTTEASFTTAPRTGSGAISFIAFGDSGTGSAEQRQLGALMSKDTFDFAMHVGDIVYGNAGGTGDATYATYQSYLFDIYSWLPWKAFVPVEGNHDSRPSNGDGRAYLDLFELPRNGATPSFPEHAERYYSFDYGPVHFVGLDTEFTFLDPARQAEQLRWLAADLTSTTQPWRVVFLHRAPYSSGGEHGSSPDVRAAFGPVFERYGVDLVLAGHEHNYERTVPIRESTTTTDRAVPYVVTGAGGAPLYASGTSSWTAFSAARHEYVKIAVDTCTLTLNTIGLDGAVFDSNRIAKCQTPATLPSGWNHADIGNTGAAGNASAASGTFSITGAGADVWGTADAFHYAYRTLEGDGSIVARVASVQNVHAWTKAGVMIRNSLSPSAAQAFMLVASSATKGVPFQRRSSDGAVTVSSPGSQSTAPRWVKLVRAGSLITGYESADGSNWSIVGSDTFDMNTTVLVGLGVSSHVTGVNATATFDNVTVTSTAPPPPPPPPPPLPAGWAAADIGNTGTTGGASGTGGTFSVKGAGADVWGSADALHYAYRTLDGDGSIVARVTSIQNVHAWTKAGVMVRNSLSPSAAQAFMLVAASATKGVPFQRRTSDGAATVSSPGSQSTAPRWVKLVRSGNVITGYESPTGTTWTMVGSDTFAMGSSVLIGLAVSSHVTGVNATAAFDNVAVTATASPPPPPPLPAGWAHADIGSTGAAGDASGSNGAFSVTGAGADVWATADALHYAYRTLTGDGTIVARVTTIEPVHAWTKTGVMIRNSLSPSAAQAFMLVAASPLKGVPFQRRKTDGGITTSSPGSQSTAPRWVKVVRSGNVIAGYESADGVTWAMVGSDTFAMGPTVLIGLGVSSHVTGVAATATFDNVTVTGNP